MWMFILQCNVTESKRRFCSSALPPGFGCDEDECGYWCRHTKVFFTAQWMLHICRDVIWIETNKLTDQPFNRSIDEVFRRSSLSCDTLKKGCFPSSQRQLSGDVAEQSREMCLTPERVGFVAKLHLIVAAPDNALHQRSKHLWKMRLQLKEACLQVDLNYCLCVACFYNYYHY